MRLKVTAICSQTHRVRSCKSRNKILVCGSHFGRWRQISWCWDCREHQKLVGMLLQAWAARLKGRYKIRPRINRRATEILGCLPAVVPALLSLTKFVLLRNVGWDLLLNGKLIDWRWRLGLGLFQRWFWVHLIWSSVWEGLVWRALTFVKGRWTSSTQHFPERYFETDLIYLQWLEGEKKSLGWFQHGRSLCIPSCLTYPTWFPLGSSIAGGLRGKRLAKSLHKALY